MLVKLPEADGPREVRCSKLVIAASGELTLDGEVVDVYALEPWWREDESLGGWDVRILPEDDDEEIELVSGPRLSKSRYGFILDAHQKPHGISFSARRGEPLFHSYGPSAHGQPFWRLYDRSQKTPKAEALVLYAPQRFARRGLPSGPRSRLSGLSGLSRASAA